jgi:hypothetical protein
VTDILEGILYVRLLLLRFLGRGLLFGFVFYLWWFLCLRFGLFDCRLGNIVLLYGVEVLEKR